LTIVRLIEPIELARWGVPALKAGHFWRGVTVHMKWVARRLRKLMLVALSDKLPAPGRSRAACGITKLPSQDAGYPQPPGGFISIAHYAAVA
jgi:hypothetical protein